MSASQVVAFYPGQLGLDPKWCECGPRLHNARKWKQHIANADYSQCADCEGWISGREIMRQHWLAEGKRDIDEVPWRKEIGE